MATLAEVKDQRATLAREARLLDELTHFEGWPVFLRALGDLESNATNHILSAATSMDMVNFWRGYLAALQEIRRLPATIGNLHRAFQGVTS